MRYPLLEFPLSDGPSRCSFRTTRCCRLYRSSHAGCRFGSSGSSGFVVSFRRLRLFSRGLAPRSRSCRDRCRYRYICRPKRIRFPLRGRLKNRKCVSVYCTYPTSRLKVLCGLQLATHATSKLEVSRRLKPVSCEDSTIRDINFPSI